MIPLVVILVVLWVGFAAISWRWHAALRGDVVTGLVLALLRLYCRVMFRVRFEGFSALPERGPLIVVSNHVSGVDPILIQCACDFEIRWMMLREMMVPWARAVWEWLDVIAVGPASDSQSARIAIKHVDAGGVLGVFPEGGISRERGVLKPFQPGVGLIVSRTGAKVMLCKIEGMRPTRSAWTSFVKPSRVVVRLLALLDYSQTNLSASEIARDLERRMASTGLEPSGSGKFHP